MNDKTTTHRLDTYCGLYCGACVIYRVNKNGSASRLAEEFGRNIQDVSCNGCRSSHNSTCSKSCRIKRCAIENHVEHCFECHDYPCNSLIEFRNDEYLHRSFVINNLEEIKEKGFAAWSASQQKRWSCSQCGEPFHWYEENCKKCGAEVFNCIKERQST